MQGASGPWIEPSIKEIPAHVARHHRIDIGFSEFLDVKQWILITTGALGRLIHIGAECFDAGSWPFATLNRLKRLSTRVITHPTDIANEGEAEALKERTPREVFYFTSGIAAGMVAVRGADGNAITELEGSYEQVRDLILAAADEYTVFECWPDD